MPKAMGSAQPAQIDPSRQPFCEKIPYPPSQGPAGQVDITDVNQPNHFLIRVRSMFIRGSISYQFPTEILVARPALDSYNSTDSSG
jgi:hypothetical protein